MLNVASAKSTPAVMATKSSTSKFVSKPAYTITKPPSYKIATQYPQWCSAMDDKFAALKRQGIWTLVSPSPSQNLVGCKWVFKLKHNSDGNISKYKARLVAKNIHISW